MELRERVVVITGGSSGLGRETAVRFAKAGSFVVVAARRERDLEETVHLCRRAGGVAEAVVADVTRAEDMQRLVDRVIQLRQRIDVWVNNAGITLFAPLTRGPLEAHRAVIETNLMGPIIAARAVLPVFRRQGEGILINVGSVLSWVAQPFVPSYVASKFGVRGITEALQAEFADDPEIHICGIYPFSIDTPHFESGATVMEHASRAIPPVQAPEKVAEAIVELARRPRSRRFVPKGIVAALLVDKLVPSVTRRLVLHTLRKWHFDETQAQPSSGNVFGPAQEGPAQEGAGTVHGHRTPRIGALRLSAWMVRDLLPTDLSGSARRRRWRERLYGVP